MTYQIKVNGQDVDVDIPLLWVPRQPMLCVTLSITDRSAGSSLLFDC